MKKNFLPILIIITFFLLIQPFLQNVVSGQNLSDTVRVECLKYVPAKATVTAEITIWNDEPIAGFQIPLTFYNPFNTDIICDSVAWSSVIWSNEPAFYGATIDSADKNLILYGIYMFNPDAWPIGDHLLATLYFTTGPTWDSSIPMTIDSTTWHFNGALGIELVDTLSQVTPYAFIPGCLNLPEVPSHTSGVLIILTAAVAGFFIFAIMMRRKVGTVK